MPHFRLVYKQQAVKDIRQLTPQVRERLKQKLEYFAAQHNPLGLAKRLTKPADAQYRFRVGNYRVLFDVEGLDLVILHIQHRKDVYRR